MKRQLTVRISGPGVLEGKIALKDLQRIVHPLEQAVCALLPASRPPASKGGPLRKPAARFLLSGIAAGSAVADLELEADPEPTLGNLDLDPLSRLIEGAEEGGGGLPDAARGHLERMAQRLPPGVECVELALLEAGPSARIYRRDPAKQVDSTQAVLTLSGRLIAADFRKGTARLETQGSRSGKAGVRRIRLEFSDELANDMQRCARQHVSVRGTAVIDAAGAVKSLKVQWIQAEIDDRRLLWAAKRFHWPAPDQRIDNVDMNEFLRTSRDDDEGDS